MEQRILDNPVVVCLGPAWSGASELAAVAGRLPGIATPTSPGDLKFLLRNDPVESFPALFAARPGDILFGSSPSAMHSGPDGIESLLRRLDELAASTPRLQVLFCLRNPLERAFAHYWRDIAGHHALYGRSWRVARKDHPDRFASLYRRSFAEELSDPASATKLLPPLAETASRIIAEFGSKAVCFLPSHALGDAFGHFLLQIGHPSAAEIPPLATAADLAPVYLYGGAGGASFPVETGDGHEEILVPARLALIVTPKETELLSATEHDLDRIVAAASTWTRECLFGSLPAAVGDFILRQHDLLSSLPQDCFLPGQRGAALAEIARIPERLSIAPVPIPVDQARRLIGMRQTSAAERDGKVMVGREDRLFLHHDMNNVMAQHLGQLRLSEKAIQAWVRMLQGRTALCQDLGITYAMVFAPDTHAVYREAIPALDHRNDPRPVQQILAAYPDTNLHYPLEALRAARSLGEVCHMTDSHWSAFGALVACREVLARMNLGVPLTDVDAVTLQDKDLVGDLGMKFDPQRAGRTTEAVLKSAQSHKVWNNGVTNRGHMSLWKGRRRDLPRALLLTDSYGWKFQVFLAQSFSDLFVVHSPLIEPEAVERFRPDVVFSLMAERFAYKVPNDREDMTALQHAEQKNPGSAYPDFLQWD